MKNSLSERQRIEENYHDRKYKDDILENSSSQGGSAYKFYRELRGNVNGLKILDYGCGNGWLSMDLIKEGATEVYGIDISKELIEKANKFAEVKGLSKNINFKKMPGENLTFPDNFFDLILGSAILHHTDISLAIKNIYRVLKPGGRALFIEPLNQNIFLRIWRKLTPWRRSPAEKALVSKDLKFIQDVFPDAKYHFFKFFSIFSKGLTVLLPKNKTLIYANVLLERFDKNLLKLFPFCGKYYAVIVMELNKN